MEYLVMECQKSYAVVLDHRGRFLKVANLGYQVGQEVSAVVELRQPKPRGVIRWQPVLTAAACLCILFVGIWQTALLSMGTVLIQINPQIRLSVNRMERVISAEAVNADGAKVLFDYHAFGKTVEQVAQELSDRAADMGYLHDDGEVHLTVDSRDAKWKTATEARLETVAVREAQRVTVIIEHDDDWDEWDDDWDDHDDDHEDHDDDDELCDDDPDTDDELCDGDDHDEDDHEEIHEDDHDEDDHDEDDHEEIHEDDHDDDHEDDHDESHGSGHHG